METNKASCIYWKCKQEKMYKIEIISFQIPICETQIPMR